MDDVPAPVSKDRFQSEKTLRRFCSSPLQSSSLFTCHSRLFRCCHASATQLATQQQVQSLLSSPFSCSGMGAASFLVICFFALPCCCLSQDVYQLGVGIADVTGPAAEIGMMGYAKPGQETAGIHFRLYSRAFVIADQSGKRICIVSCDLGMISQIVRLEVVKSLKEKYNGIYDEKNVLISATHTHSGPGGFLQYLLYTVVTQGFTKQTFDAIVSGITLSIDRAHTSMTPGKIYWNQGQLLDASINRSPTAYINNRPEERDKYPYDTDKDMYLMKFVSLNGQPLGVLTWFAVHPTSMNNSNHLISGDNKGWASLLFERDLNGPDVLPGRGPFVAAFSNANLGDVSPNLNGPRCLDTGLPCDNVASTCGGRVQMCIASGPGRDMFESTGIIATRQYEKAMELYKTASQAVRGPVSFIHQHIDMSNQTFRSQITGQIVSTCKPAMGYSFAAGTIDGPGAFDFRQGTRTGNGFWNMVRDFIAKPSQDLIECHAPKPILLATGLMKFPYQWQPTILPTQILRVGNVFIAGLPAEFTTMSGRRIREILTEQADKTPGTSAGETKVVLAGLANAYSSYVTTFEEYQVQRYEAASTIFGPRTLEAYISQYSRLLKALLTETPLPPGPDPPNLLKKQISLRPGVVYDGIPFGKRFGDVVYDVHPRYLPGEQVYCAFVAGNPRNDLQQEKTFLTVERRERDHWYIVATDADLETKFYWHKTNSLFGESQATITWDIPLKITKGIYRIRHFGASKNLLQTIRSYVGISSEFEIV